MKKFLILTAAVAMFASLPSCISVTRETTEPVVERRETTVSVTPTDGRTEQTRTTTYSN